MLLGLLAIQLLHLGLVEQARARLQRAHARARELGQPMARLVAIWYDALFEVRLGNAERVAALADEMRALVDEFALGAGRTAAGGFAAGRTPEWASRSRVFAGSARRYEENARLGMLAGGSEVLGYAAEALVLAGDWDAAQGQLEEALQIANTRAERVYLPQLFLMQAAIARARGESTPAEASVRRAVAEARAQEAPWLELLALIELCEQGSANAEDRHALAALVEQLPEASDTAAVKRARALLDGTMPAGRRLVPLRAARALSNAVVSRGVRSVTFARSSSRTRCSHSSLMSVSKTGPITRPTRPNTSKPPRQPIRTQTKCRRVPSRATVGRTILSPQNRTTQPNENERSARRCRARHRQLQRQGGDGHDNRETARARTRR